MNTTQYLQTVRQKISNPQHWTKGAFARDSNGMAVMELNEEAVCWCIMGAVFACDNTNDQFVDGVYIVSQLIFTMGYPTVSSFNDSSTHEQVLSMLDAAIEISKQ